MRKGKNTFTHSYLDHIHPYRAVTSCLLFKPRLLMLLYFLLSNLQFNFADKVSHAKQNEPENIYMWIYLHITHCFNLCSKKLQKCSHSHKRKKHIVRYLLLSSSCFLSCVWKLAVYILHTMSTICFKMFFTISWLSFVIWRWWWVFTGNKHDTYYFTFLFCTCLYYRIWNPYQLWSSLKAKLFPSFSKVEWKASFLRLMQWKNDTGPTGKFYSKINI